MKNDLRGAVSGYVHECEAKKRKKKRTYQNLTKYESEGLAKLQMRDDVFQTDKSGRFAVDMSENYV